jgi:uncharacterized protein (TIGR02145 family)
MRYACVITSLTLLISTSCKKESVAISTQNPINNSIPCPDSLNDIDGNPYRVLNLYGQCWLKENLKTSHYQNGDSIAEIQNDNEWASLTSGAFSKYQNNSLNDSIYGKLYNGFSVSDPRNVCPAGWHVSTDADWGNLIDSLGGEGIAGGLLKSTELWAMPNTGASNSVEFTALPGGMRDADHGGFFSNAINSGYWWSASSENAPAAFVRYINYPNVNVNRYSYGKKNGFSVRCVRD